jgi:Spy/CpxP family protein refolding chaperone
MHINDESSRPQNRQSPQHDSHVARRKQGRRIVLATALSAVALLGLAQGLAVAHGFGPDGAGPGRGHGRGPMGGGAHMMKKMNRVLDAAGASDDQRAKVRAIWDNLRPQLHAAHQEHHAVHQEIAQAVAAPTIDKNHVEQLRKRALGAMDKASALMTQGMIASAEVLTPEQRQKALVEIGKHRFRHGPGAGDDAATPTR